MKQDQTKEKPPERKKEVDDVIRRALKKEWFVLAEREDALKKRRGPTPTLNLLKIGQELETLRERIHLREEELAYLQNSPLTIAEE